MERLDVFDCSNVLIASYFTDDRGCAHENREHTLIYLCSGELEIEERGKKTVLHPGDCAFMRRDNRMWLQKKVEDGKPYRSVVLKFSRPFLREFYQTLNRQQIPNDSEREKVSLRVLPSNRLDIRSLFESVIPYFDAGEKPSEDVLKLKMVEGIYVLLNTDRNLYASLFDFVEPWKIDILDYLNENYMCDLSLEEIASYTGRTGYLQAGLCQSQQPDTAKVDYQTSSGSRARPDKIRQEESDGSLLRCGFQEPVAFLQDIQGGLWCRSFMVR